LNQNKEILENEAYSVPEDQFNKNKVKRRKDPIKEGLTDDENDEEAIERVAKSGKVEVGF
jgi:hypothetical protein